MYFFHVILGKLGLGHCSSKGTPTVIEELKGTQVIKIGSGKNYSVFLTAKGQVLACGVPDLTSLDPSQSKLNRPCLVPNLETVNVIDISAGAEHVLVLSDQGQVYGWGNNFSSQLGLDPDTHGDLILKPTLIPGLSGIKQISAGNLHSSAWTSVPATPDSILNFGQPQQIPERYDLVQNIDIDELKTRLMKLNKISDLVKTSWRLLPRDYVQCDPSNPLSLNSLRLTFDPSTFSLPLVRTLQITMTIGKQAMQQVSVKRHLKSSLSTKQKFFKRKLKWKFESSLDDSNGGISESKSDNGTIFGQVSHQILSNFNAQSLRLPSQAWKVKLIGEGADDAGGVFDDIVSEMCRELTDPRSNLNLLIKTPNAKDDVGLHRDKYLLNSEDLTKRKEEHFRFLGMNFKPLPNECF